MRNVIGIDEHFIIDEDTGDVFAFVVLKQSEAYIANSAGQYFIDVNVARKLYVRKMNKVAS